MSEQKYELAFYGKLVEGSALDETKELVAQLFKTNVEQIERMFTGNRVVIRNKLDQSMAMKYIDALKKRGALCQIELMGQPGVAVNFEQESQESVSGAQPQAEGQRQTQTAPENAPVSTPASQAVNSDVSAGVSSKPSSPKGSMSVNGLPIVGEKVDEILSSAHMDLAPVGVRLAEEKQQVTADLHALDGVSLAPPGSDLLEKQEKPPVAAPDTSHIQLAPNDD